MRNKRVIKIIVILLIYFCYLSFCYKVNAEDDITNELLKSQSSTLGISSFIEEANKYKSEDFDIDVNELITSAIKGNVDNQTIGRKILAQLFSGAREAISTIRKHYGNYNNYILHNIYFNSNNRNEKFFRYNQYGKGIN